MWIFVAPMCFLYIYMYAPNLDLSGSSTLKNKTKHHSCTSNQSGLQLKRWLLSVSHMTETRGDNFKPSRFSACPETQRQPEGAAFPPLRIDFFFSSQDDQQIWTGTSNLFYIYYVDFLLPTWNVICLLAEKNLCGTWWSCFMSSWVWQTLQTLWQSWVGNQALKEKKNPVLGTVAIA